MELGKRAVASWLWVHVAVIGGIALVLVGEGMLTMVGVVAIIIGLISLMPALMFTLEEEGEPTA